MYHKIIRHFRHFFHHARGGAIPFHGGTYRLFDLGGVQRTEQVEMEVNIRENFGMGFLPVTLHGNLDVPQFLPLLAHHVDHVHRAAGTHAGEEELHGPHALVRASDAGRAVDIDGVARSIAAFQVERLAFCKSFYGDFHLESVCGK